MSFNFGTPAAKPASFGFGSPATSFGTPVGGGGGFGQPAATSTSAFGFGTTPTASVAPSFGGGFGAAPASTASTFGFGMTSSAPSTTPAFSGFGATSSAPAFGATGGAPAFGTTSAPPPFGATTSMTPAFGATGTASPFGATSAAPAFGATSTAPAFGAVSGFGTPASSAAPALGFGAVTSTAPPAFGSLGGLPASSAPSFGFGATASTAPPAFSGFGAATNTAAGGAFGVAAPVASSAAPAFGFGSQISTSTPASTAFGFGGAMTTTSGGLGGLPTPASQPNLLSSTASSLSTTTGLGGTVFPPMGTAGSTTAAGGNEAKNDAKALKEMSVPPELFTAVEDFKKHVKEEKSLSSDIVHMTSKIHEKIAADTDGLRRLVTVLSSELSKQKHQMEKLKKDISEGLVNAEVAQRTKDCPPGLQFENVAPQEYFMRLISNFEVQMVSFRRQIDETEQTLKSMTSQESLTPGHLLQAIRKQHEAFVSLAAKYQNFHESVKNQREIFSNFYRMRFRSEPGFFVDRSRTAKIGSHSSHSATVGPSPFTDQMDGFARARATMAAHLPNQAMTGPPTLGLGSTNPLSSGVGSAYGSTTMFGSSNPNPGALGGGSSSSSSSSSFLQQNISGFSGLGAPSTPGMFGTTMSPFANNNSSTSSIFQTSGKRGKH